VTGTARLSVPTLKWSVHEPTVSALTENLAWLLEMGYVPDTKAANGQTTTALRAQLPRSAVWVKVGDNAEMVLIGEHTLHGCPYP